MNLQERKAALLLMGDYLKDANDAGWQEAKRRAAAANGWFTEAFINLAAANIAERFLTAGALQQLIDRFGIGEPLSPKRVGIVMAGNVPMVGFHDLLCTFLCGHYAVVKPSSKDEVLMTYVVEKLIEFAPAAEPYLTIAERLNGCEAYIATGSNNSAAVFEHYFSKYPHIIRRNRTSVAVLTGAESAEDLQRLADDVYAFFGLGCRNVTKLFVPKDYNFEPLVAAFRKYDYLADHSKYKNNYDYNLAIALLNRRPFMSGESLLLLEDESLFSPIAQLNYSFYENADEVYRTLQASNEVQCVVGQAGLPFGEAQQPGVCDFADGVNTVEFLQSLS